MGISGGVFCSARQSGLVPLYLTSEYVPSYGLVGIAVAPCPGIVVVAGASTVILLQLRVKLVLKK